MPPFYYERLERRAFGFSSEVSSSVVSPSVSAFSSATDSSTVSYV